MVDLPFTRFTLDNGLQVIVHEDHAVPVVAVNLWYQVGSKDERPGRTGFAHLFEHLMFEGSANVPVGVFDELLESVGGVNNGSTSTDRTNYWETVPATALELALFLEADRMGGLTETMSQDKLDAQRDVVKNERRQSYENRPYGLAWETIHAALYPPDHPYHWPIIGWMPDLDAASLDDVTGFFRTYYTPNNASLAIAGAVDAEAARALVEKHFGDIPKSGEPPRPAAHTPPLTAPLFLTLEDDVHLPRLYFTWHSPPIYQPGDAELDALAGALAQGKAARLYHSLVYDRGVAQDVEAFQGSALLTSTFHVVVTARPDVDLTELASLVWEELERAATRLDDDEIRRAVRRIETNFIDSLQTVGGFGGRADRLNHYAFYVGEPGYADRDLARYRELTAASVAAAGQRYLRDQPAVTLSVVPRGGAARGVQSRP